MEVTFNTVNISGDTFIDLPQGDVCLAEYVWMGGGHTTGGFDMRCKTKMLKKRPVIVDDLPIWNYDGSSTEQAPGENSEVLLRPVAMFNDPFRPGGNNILVLCETMTPQMQPLGPNKQRKGANTRHAAKIMFDSNLKEEPWFGLEQEYTLFEKDGRTPLGWPTNGFPGPQGPYYCSAGTDCSYGRQIADAHLKACVYAGLDISGINGEVMPGQWEYQIGPTTGIDSGDQVWISRYIMIRVCEHFKVIVTFEPKPMSGDWNGAGCHTNFSTKSTREAGGYKRILEMCEALGTKHKEHIDAYGEGNEKRLTGRHETSSIDRFAYGVADRGASIRIPSTAEQEGCGYFEDRRPSSNMDPYIVTSKIFDTCVNAPVLASPQ